MRLVAKVIRPLPEVLHSTKSVGSITCAVGLTVMVKVSAGPTQFTEPLAMVGVTVIVALIGEVPALVAVNEAMFPEPLAPRPMAVLLFAHAYVVVPTVRSVVKVIRPLAPLLHRTMLAGSLTCAVGLTVIVNVSAGPTQFTEIGRASCRVRV